MDARGIVTGAVALQRKTNDMGVVPPSVSAARRHDEVALFVIPAVAEVEFDWRRIALLEDLPQFRLVVLFENLDRADVIAEDADVPFVVIEIGERNAGVVLQ